MLSGTQYLIVFLPKMHKLNVMIWKQIKMEGYSTNKWRIIFTVMMVTEKTINSSVQRKTKDT